MESLAFGSWMELVVAGLVWHEVAQECELPVNIHIGKINWLTL
jgi:hypothetical protein